MTADTVWLIANPAAGGGRAVRRASAAARLLSSYGVSCRLVQPGTAEGTVAAAQQAREDDAAAVLACGGDGTVHRVLQGLVGGEVPLAILPGGSGDDVATSLGFDAAAGTEGVRAMAGAILARRTRVVDVGRVHAHDGTQRWFLGVLSTGFDSAVNERANTMTRLGGQRYTAAMLRELTSFRAADYELDIDGTRVRGSAMLVAVGNGPQYGGGMQVCPGARPDDGELHVTWLGAVSKARFLRSFPSVYSGRHVRFPYVQTYRGRRLTIAAPGQVAYADGERIGPLPISISCHPGALRVLAL